MQPKNTKRRNKSKFGKKTKCSIIPHFRNKSPNGTASRDFLTSKSAFPVILIIPTQQRYFEVFFRMATVINVNTEKRCAFNIVDTGSKFADGVNEGIAEAWGS
jgi:hypothetical protein